MISVRLAQHADTDRLVGFIGDHWSATHIFAHRPELFSWQHAQQDGRLNMVIATETETETETDIGSGEVVAVLGFIPMGRFDPALGDRDVMLAIWKVRETGVPPGLGLQLLKLLQRELNPRLIAAIGTSQQVRRLYEVLGYQVGALHQVALFGPTRNQHSIRIASGVPPGAFAPASSSQCAVTLKSLGVDTPDDITVQVDALAADRLPAKSWQYIVERYFRHPWYTYEVRQVLLDDVAVAVIVWRAVSVAGNVVLRVVDIIGDTTWLRHGGQALQEAIAGADAEYLDIVQWGIDDDVLRLGGFIGLDDAPGMVLPNYFAPFEERNVEIELALKVLQGDQAVQLFRADSDQDRPNLIAELDSTN